jgi:hypothetical protein
LDDHTLIVDNRVCILRVIRNWRHDYCLWQWLSDNDRLLHHDSLGGCRISVAASMVRWLDFISLSKGEGTRCRTLYAVYECPHCWKGGWRAPVCYWMTWMTFLEEGWTITR